MSVIRFLLCSIVLLVPLSAQTIPTSNLKLWFSADCITNVSGCAVPADGTTITTWADQSGNNDTATVNSGSMTFHTAQVNGQPAVTCNTNCGMLLAATIPAGTTYSAFAVTKITDLTFPNADYVLIGCHNTGTCFLYGAMNAARNVIAHGSFGNLANGTVVPDTKWHETAGSIVTNSSYAFRFDCSGADGSGAPSSGTINDPIGALFRDENGNSASWRGQIAELILYNRLLTSTEITTVENYLAIKYRTGGACGTSGPHVQMILY